MRWTYLFILASLPFTLVFTRASVEWDSTRYFTHIVDKITKSLKLLEQRMDLGSVDHRLEEFNALSENPSFWQDQKKAQTLMRKTNGDIHHYIMHH